MPKFTDIATLPEHGQIYFLSFDGMKGAKTSGVHDWQVFEIWVARSDCPNKNCIARIPASNVTQKWS